MRKTISLVLSILLILAVITSCSDNNTTDQTSTETETSQISETVTDETLSPEQERNAISDDLPDADYQGYNFRYYYYGEDTFEQAMVPAEMTGDVVMDAVYERNSIVEERFNITISAVAGATGWSEMAAAEKRVILAGDDAYDLSFEHIIGGPNNSLEHLYINFYDIPHLNFDKPWWQKAVLSELSVNDRMYVTSNDLSTEGISSSKVHFFNKGKLRDYGLDEPYPIVEEGLWTLDKVIAMTSNVYEDINGNGEQDDEDFYGYITHRVQNGFLVSCDISVLQKTNDDSLMQINVNSEKMQTLVEKLYNWYFESGGTYKALNRADMGQVEVQEMMFGGGHGLFAFSHLSAASKSYRLSDVEYGIIPFPKWDERQEDYRTFSAGLLLAVPITSTDLERTGTIIEALSAEGYKRVTPAYFETALKEKFSFDNETVKMLDIINSSRAISFAYAYDNWEGFGHIFSAIFGSDSPSKDYSSFYASRIGTAEKRMEKIITAFSS